MTLNKKQVAIISGIYFLILIYLLFFAFFRDKTNTHVNTMPFATMWPLTKYTFTTGHGIWHWIINVPGNIVAFFPLPFFVLAFSDKKRVNPFLIFLILSIPFIIEYIQYFFQIGSCDVDDVILNEAGILTGYLILYATKKASSK